MKTKKEEPKLVEVDEWIYKGCTIQKQNPHPELSGRYEIFRNDSVQTHVGRAYNFKGAKKLCI
jgi:hypothetical protein